MKKYLVDLTAAERATIDGSLPLSRRARSCTLFPLNTNVTDYSRVTEGKYREMLASAIQD
ncbi:MAG: hypothetical protein HYZ50_17025 [Deltaproteobacteria bacterium]|nr:hypothetical protein [Deltaproteobacteria bacterium]